MALSVNSSESYWLVSSSGQVFAFGQARSYGSEAGKHFRGQIVGIVSTPNGKGYWLISSTGQRFGFGDAHLYRYTATKLQKLTGRAKVKNLHGRIVGVAIAKLQVAKVATVSTATATTSTPTPTTSNSAPPVTTTTTSTPTVTQTTTSSTPAAIAPTATAHPTIAASGTVGGDELTASTNTWANSPTSYTYQWKDCNGSVCANVSAGGTSRTYVLAPSDVGSTIEVTETASNTAGTSAPDTSARTAVITAPATLAISTTSLADAPQNIGYTEPVSASGGYAPYAWGISSGALPTGLNINASTGAIYGTPTVSGSCNFQVTVTDNDGTPATANYTLTVTAPIAPTITTTTVPYPVENLAYSTTLGASGGYTPYSWTLTGGSSLPAGLTLTSGGTVQGTASTPGTYTFTATVTGADGASSSSTYLLMVASPTDSYNWSGYVEETTGAFTSASGSFTVATLDAGDSSTNELAEWVGVDGWADSDLIQAGVNEQPGSNPYAWWEILPDSETPIAETVAPGDQISVSIAEVSPQTACSSTLSGDPVTSGVEWNVDISDATQGWDYPQPLCYDGPGESAEWILEAPELPEGGDRAEIVPLAPFSPQVGFTDLETSTSASALDYTTIVQHPGTGVECNTSRGTCTAPTDPSQVATPSLLDPNGFNVAYGSTAPASP